MKIGTINKTKNTLNESDFHIKKRFGQNFIIDQNILKKIVEIPDITDETLVIEIGPGLGSLTELLLAKAKHVLAYEIDFDLIPILEKSLPSKNFTLLNRDFLKTDVDVDIKDLDMNFDKVIVVANLPYYITTPIIFKLIEDTSLVKEMILMTQLEVAKRITSKPSTKDYNSLSIAIQYKTKASIAMNVPRNVFIPPPNVDSAVIRLEVFESVETKPESEELFYEIIRASFTQRRKTLINNLNFKYGISKDILSNLLVKLGLNPKIRAENLSLLDFINLSNNLADIIKTS